ncbi:class I SAM-dependent methyltransferase [Streptomyces sp. NBC_01481]|uniref:class I SAM-dependent methyltransferase n=1 Tax=Streptomyces sp. NBC_01481 TaxID=2975869 RepID=UPI002250E18B|nr:class I SAM-dependent methyltransferase [Streptomyces sp. NBC_01481]MCX4585380.1 class I SAM-dependent methyltransferase [Streptomyces sp. NBC_01481]
MSISLAPKSLTHQHLLASVNTELSSTAGRDSLRVLDVGCGEGDLVAFLQAGLTDLNPGVAVEVHGFDVIDTLSNRPDFPKSTVDRLESLLPGEPWADRIQSVSQHEAWPYPDGSFDIVVSNQVLEHVVRLRPFLAQLSRVLVPGGRSMHVFPLRNALCDGHVLMPLIHRVRGHEQRAAMARMWRWLKVGNNRTGDIRETAERISTYLHLGTTYRYFEEFSEESKRADLKLSYRYTQELYQQKIASVLGRRGLESYCRSRRAVIDWIAFCVLRHVSSITLVFEK